ARPGSLRGTPARTGGSRRGSAVPTRRRGTRASAHRSLPTRIAPPRRRRRRRRSHQPWHGRSTVQGPRSTDPLGGTTNLPAVETIPLSVVVVSYEMARELPRTVRSLSPGYQRGIDAADYEVIVVDNGTPAGPVDLDDAAGGLQLRSMRLDPAPPS